MLFPTIDFAVFFVIVFTGSWLLRPHPKPWRYFLLAASLFFYGYWDWRFVFLLGGSIVLNWAFASVTSTALAPDGTSTRRSRWIVRGAVAVNLGVLGLFKYYEFFRDSVVERLDALGLSIDPPLLDIILPVGISFFTFQALSYVIDVGRGEWRRPLNLLDFAVFLSFFPQLVAGPIVRADEFAWQLDGRADPRSVESSEAFMLIFRGLFKKVVISSYMATVVDPVFAFPQGHSNWEVLWAMYAYAIQIYADFSGYTDIAIGVALLMGFRFPQNFDAPYRALSVQDFWRRWHMTLSRWLRDYLYIPLGGNRGSRLVAMVSPAVGNRPLRAFVYANLFLTMLLGGLWHGANWTFVIWGSIYGIVLVAERAVKSRWHERGPLGLPLRAVHVLQWVLTFHIVVFAWVFFRAQSLDGALDLLGQLFTGGDAAGGLVTPLFIATIVLMIGSQFVPTWVPERVQLGFGRLAPALQIVVVAVALVAVNTLGPEGIAPFIYFQF